MDCNPERCLCIVGTGVLREDTKKLRIFKILSLSFQPLRFYFYSYVSNFLPSATCKTVVTLDKFSTHWFALRYEKFPYIKVELCRAQHGKEEERRKKKKEERRKKKEERRNYFVLSMRLKTYPCNTTERCFGLPLQYSQRVNNHFISVLNRTILLGPQQDRSIRS